MRRVASRRQWHRARFFPSRPGFLPTAIRAIRLTRGAESLLVRFSREPVPNLPLAPGQRSALPQRPPRVLGPFPLRRRDGRLRRLGDLQLRGGRPPRAPRPEAPRDDADDSLPRSAPARPAPEAREPRLHTTPRGGARALRPRDHRPPPRSARRGGGRRLREGLLDAAADGGRLHPPGRPRRGPPPDPRVDGRGAGPRPGLARPAAARNRGDDERDALLVPAPSGAAPPAERRPHLRALRCRD